MSAAGLPDVEFFEPGDEKFVDYESLSAEESERLFSGVKEVLLNEAGTIVAASRTSSEDFQSVIERHFGRDSPALIGAVIKVPSHVLCRTLNDLKEHGRI